MPTTEGPPIEVLRAAREWAAEHRHQIPDDRLIGIAFAAGLAAGRAEDPLLAELVRAAQTWRAQFYKPAESKPPRMAALINAVDALAAARVAENGADHAGD